MGAFTQPGAIWVLSPTSFEMVKNLYGMPVQVVETIKKENEKSAILIKIIK